MWTLDGVAILIVGFVGFYRPGQLRWGATQEEPDRPLPGDEVVTAPTFNANAP